MKSSFDVVVIGASAGGIEAVSVVLRALPKDFPAAVIVAMHFHSAGTRAAGVFGRQANMPVRGVAHGERLEPGAVYVCPPDRAIELEPDGTVSLVTRANAEHPIDATLESAATSYRARALAVILTGMRTDGARGVCAVKAHGGTVIVQSEASSLHPSMPKAAIETGVVDVVLPLEDVGKTVAAFVAGGTLPATDRRVAALDWVFGGEGTLPALLRAVDWTATSLGPIEDWPAELQAIIRLIMSSPMAMGMMLGKDYTLIVNDAAARTVGRKPEEVVGRPYFDTWPEMKPLLGPLWERIVNAGETFFSEDALYEFDANGRIEEKYITSAFLPITTRRGVEGVFGPGVESTDNVLAARRMRTLAKLAAVPRTRDVNAAFVALLEALDGNPNDVPFALAYEIDAIHRQATLKSALHVERGSAIAPYVVDLRSPRAPWPFGHVFESGAPLLVSDLAARFGMSKLGPWPDPTAEALVYPIGGSPPAAALVVGLNRRRLLDPPYRDFLDLLAAQIHAGILEAEAFTTSKKRVDALAEANRMKTELFSNVSHEFRTPLTLILGPLERALSHREKLPNGVASDLVVAERSAKRLQLLVSSLLDISQAEAHRLMPRFEKIDLAETTKSIVALFTSAVDAAGLSLVVDCPPLGGPVPIDREMWAKIVVNLMSNALKFTGEGEIRVVLRERAQHAELVVSDTGVGIDEADQPHVFDRFFRGTRVAPRSSEGSGIGLALVRELVQLHHGRIRVQSKPGEGATFTVWVPTTARISTSPVPLEPTHDVVALAEGALAWAQTPPEAHGIVGSSQLEGLEAIRAATTGACVLVVDDNADMRGYMQQLLREMGWRVETANDGDAAISRLREIRADIVVADVMMPKSDGFELLRRLRADAELRETPVVLVTARAGESAAVDGLVAGANDYITKPFSARELAARVGGQIELARVRKRVDQTIRSVFDALPMGVGVFDQNGSLITSNPEMRRFIPTGILPSRDPARRDRWTFSNGTADGDFPGARALRGERVVPGVDMRYLDESGKAIATHVSAVPLRASEGSDAAAFVVVDDVTAATETSVRYRALVAATSYVVYRMSPDWSEMTELRGAGFLRDTAEAKRGWLEEYIAPEDRAHVLEAVNAAIREKRMFELEHRVRRADGTIGWTMSRAVPILDAADRIVEWVGAASDVTARKEAEASLVAELRDTELLRELSARLVTERDVEVVYEHVIDAAIAVGHADGGTLQVVDDGSSELVIIASRGFDDTMRERFRRVQAGSNTPCGAALATGERTFVEFDADDPHAEAGYVSAQSTPLVARGGRRIGMLTTHWRKRHRPNARELGFLDLLARQAADLIALSRA